MTYDPYAAESDGDLEVTQGEVYLRHIRQELQQLTAAVRDLATTSLRIAQALEAQVYYTSGGMWTPFQADLLHQATQAAALGCSCKAPDWPRWNDELDAVEHAPDCAVYVPRDDEPDVDDEPPADVGPHAGAIIREYDE